MLSGEFRTPIEAMKGFVSILLRDSVQDEKTRIDLTQRIRGRIEDLEALVSEMLVVAQIE